MIRTVLMLTFWAVALPVAAVVCFPWTFISGDIGFLYRFCMFCASAGAYMAGVRVEMHGLERIDPTRTYIYMSNHVSNIDPPIMLPRIPRRTSVMAKKELFSYPLLGKIMRLGSLVPVDRGNRDAGIAAVRAATEVVQSGVNMTIYVEGKRSFDGRLLPFKKGPFYLAEACNVAVVPVTITGTHHVMPKGRFAIKPGKVDLIFHHPIEPRDFGGRDCLIENVRRAINSGLPEELRQSKGEREPARIHGGTATA